MTKLKGGGARSGLEPMSNALKITVVETGRTDLLIKAKALFQVPVKAVRHMYPKLHVPVKAARQPIVEARPEVLRLTREEVRRQVPNLLIGLNYLQ